MKRTIAILQAAVLLLAVIVNTAPHANSQDSPITLAGNLPMPVYRASVP
jgi:hypothetical protein